MSELESNLPPQPGTPPAKSVRKITMPTNKNAETRRILLEENADIPPIGQFIGHNGHGYLLKPGIWVDVPLPIIEVLDHAVMEVPEIDPDTRRVVGWRQRLRYPYRVSAAA
jgi:hypothetical protein